MAKAEKYPDTGSLKGDKKILQVAVERFKQCLNNTDIIRAEGLEDLMFFANKQWLESLLKDRADDRRPALTINRLPGFVNQVTNDMRQNRPAVKIRATNTEYKDNADVIDGLIRNIFNNGDSKTAIDTAGFYQVVTGMGYLRIVTDYCNDKSFDQYIKIQRMDNPFAVYFPVHLCQELDFSDAPYCFVRSKMSKEDFAAKYPNSTTLNFEEQGAGDPNWQGPDYVYVAEYFSVEKEMSKLYLLSDGSTVTDKSDIGELTVVKERDVEKRTVKWYLMTEFEVLDTRDWPSKYIPIVPVLGQELNENGKKQFISLVRNAKDPQRMYNFMYSAFAEELALAPKAPYIAAEGQIDNFKQIWQTANLKNHSYLPYTPTSHEGQLLPAPQRVQPPNAGSSLVQGIQMASEQLKETTGIFDASLGSKGNETSGRAIIARQKEGDTANYHFTDNLAKSMTYIGKVLLDLIPIIYDTPRAIRILGEDMTDEVIQINSAYGNEDGKLYDMSIGEYEVMVDIGPSYSTKRVETAQNLISVIQAIPTLGASIGDILLRQLDFPLSGEAADRIKRLINTTMPGVIEEEGKEPGAEMTPEQTQQVVADLQKVMELHKLTMQENEQLRAIVTQLQMQIKDKEADRQHDMDKTVLKASTEMQKARMELAHDQGKHSVDTAVKLQGMQVSAEPDMTALKTGGMETE